MDLKGSQIVIETIIEQGTKVVFGYPGGTVLDIYDAVYQAEADDRLVHVLTAGEQGAAYAADGYARATGEVGVAIATSGPGSTNLVTGVATAQLDSIPVVFITGNVSTSLIGKDSFQEVDITGITEPITKHNFLVTDPNKLADTIREAFRIAKSGRPGPVLVDIPKNIQQTVMPFEPGPVVEPFESPRCKQRKLDKAAALIAEAERPYIYIGGGAVAAGAGPKILELAERMDAAVGSSLMGMSEVPTGHPRFLGMEGMHGTYTATKALDACDLLLTLGARFSDRATGDTDAYCTDARIIHVDIDRAEVDKNIEVDLGIGGTLTEAVDGLLERVAPAEHPAWWDRIHELQAAYDAQVQANYPAGVLTPDKVIAEVAKHTDAATPIVTDVGQHQMWVAQYYPFERHRTFISSGGLGTMGYGLGAAIGAACGTGRRTVLFTGDGSFGMDLNELATVATWNLPIVVVVMNNGVLGMVRQWQHIFYDERYSSTTLRRATDFPKLAEAFGVRGLAVRTLDELAPVMAEAFSSLSPVVVDVAIDKDEFVLPMLPPGGTFEQLIVDKEGL